MEVENAVYIPDGIHKGIIQKPELKAYEYKGKTIEYLNIPIKLEEEDIVLNYSCPAKITKNTKLGKLLSIFVVLDGIINVEKVLEGQKVVFQTITTENDRGSFAEIVPDSIKPDSD